MNGTLDRVLELAISDLIDIEGSGLVQCVPNLLGSGENEAILPRIVTTCESQESPEFQEVSTGIYGVYPVRTIVACMVEATGASSSDELEDLVAATDAVLIYNGDLLGELTAGNLVVYGVVPGSIRQERNGNKLIRYREMTIWARIHPPVPPGFIVDDSTGEMVTDDITGEPITPG
jgi:hypothetical protein